MAKDIFVIKTMGDALRNTGYKNIECAMSEIIDNSVQANAKDIIVIVSEAYNSNTGRNNISEIAFLDNGNGMSYSEIEGCLGIGYSTRLIEKEWDDLVLDCHKLHYMLVQQLMYIRGKVDMRIVRKFFWI